MEYVGHGTAWPLDSSQHLVLSLRDNKIVNVCSRAECLNWPHGGWEFTLSATFLWPEYLRLTIFRYHNKNLHFMALFILLLHRGWSWFICACVCVCLPFYPSIHPPVCVPTYLPNYSIPTYLPTYLTIYLLIHQSNHPHTHVYHVYVCIYIYMLHISIFKNKSFCHLRPGLSSCLIHWDFPIYILPSLLGSLANCEKRLLASSSVRLCLCVCVRVEQLG